MASKFDPLLNCLNLRCKQMTYQLEDEPAAEGDAFDASMYWCECTQTGRGPDDEPVDRQACSCRDRSCFEGIQNLT